VIDIVGAKHRSEELLHIVRIFVGAPRAAHSGDCIPSGLTNDLLEFAGDEIQGFVPTGLAEEVALPDERGG